MAKRFTDSEKWLRPWFRALPAGYKLLWLYILDHCDMAGVWYKDIDLATTLIGCKFDEPTAMKYLGKQIEPLNCGSRWLIKDFIGFQYRELDPRKSKAHFGVLRTLEGHGLTYNKDTLSIGYGKGMHTLQAKAKATAKAKA